MSAGSAGGRNVKDMAGTRVGDLLVVRRDGSKGRLAAWECECPCGKRFRAVGADIRAGKTKTCGCRKSIKSRRNFQGFREIGKGYWSSLVNNADQRGIDFDISIEESWEIYQAQGGRCALSGQWLSFDRKNHTASLDRIDSSQGYSPKNVQWVHRDINRMKGSFGNEEFIETCRKIAAWRS